MKVKSIIALLFAAYGTALAADNSPPAAKEIGALLAHVQSNALEAYEQALSAPMDSKSLQLIEARKLLDMQLVPSTVTAVPGSTDKLNRLKTWLSLVENDLAGQRSANQPLKRNVFLVGVNRKEIHANLETYSCEGTLTLLPGDYAARLKPGQRVWVALDSNATSTVQLSTAGSDVDTRIEVYSDHCPSEAQAPEHVQDDDLGLNARFEIAPQLAKKKYLAVLADQAGHAQIHVALANGQISGQFTLASNISNSFVNIIVGRVEYNYFETIAISYQPSGSGSYNIPVASGTYFVIAEPSLNSSQFFLGQAYPNSPCGGEALGPYCSLNVATPVIVQNNQTTSGINFSLTEGGIISGRINGYNNSQNPYNALIYVKLPHPQGDRTFSAYVDLTGRYRIPGLPPGIYKAASRIFSFRDQVYNGVNCPLNGDCDFALGTTINLALNENRANIDFTPQALPTVFGRVILTDPNVSPYYTSVYIYNENGYVINASVGPSGNYSATLGPGTYYLSFSENSHVPQLYQSRSCVTNFGNGRCLNYTSGNTFLVTYDQNLEINTTLLPKGSVAGQIRDDAGLPVEAATVKICSTNNPIACSDSNGSYSAQSNAQGYYEIRGVNSGGYYLLAISTKHIDRAFPNIDCQIIPDQNCNVQLAGAQEISITDGQQTSGINIVMSRAGTIKGKIIAPNQAYVSFDVYKTGYVAGAYISTVSYAVDGQYQIDDLVAGEYRILAGRQNSYSFPQIYANRTCAYSALFPCNVTTGEPIILGDAEITTNRDFILENRYAISGSITNNSGQSNSGVVLEAWEARPAPGLPIRRASTVSDADGRYTLITAFFDPYNYFVATNAGRTFVNQIYSGVICPQNTSAYLGSCGFLGATALTLPANTPGQFTNVNFLLAVSSEFDNLLSSGFEARE